MVSINTEQYRSSGGVLHSAVKSHSFETSKNDLLHGVTPKTGSSSAL